MTAVTERTCAESGMRIAHCDCDGCTDDRDLLAALRLRKYEIANCDYMDERERDVALLAIENEICHKEALL